jgi:hypothetical protein
VSGIADSSGSQSGFGQFTGTASVLATAAASSSMAVSVGIRGAGAIPTASAATAATTATTESCCVPGYSVRSIRVVTLLTGGPAIVMGCRDASGYRMLPVLDQTSRIAGGIWVGLGRRPASRSGTTSLPPLSVLFLLLLVLFVQAGDGCGSQPGRNDRERLSESAVRTGPLPRARPAASPLYQTGHCGTSQASFGHMFPNPGLAAFPTLGICSGSNGTGGPAVSGAASSVASRLLTSQSHGTGNGSGTKADLRQRLGTRVRVRAAATAAATAVAAMAMAVVMMVMVTGAAIIII